MQELSQNYDVNCLAINKLKARITKDRIIKDKLSHVDTLIANKMVRYKTLLSENMLKSIKTQQLQDFKREVQQYCSNQYRQYDKLIGRYQNGNEKPNIHNFINQIKQSTKTKIKNNNQKLKTGQSLKKERSLIIEPLNLNKTEKIVYRQNKEKEKQIIPLGNSKIKEAFSPKKQKAHSQQFNISQGLNYHFANLTQRQDKTCQKPTLSQKKQIAKDQEDDEYILGPSKSLKKESDRLKSSFQMSNYKKFLPLGKIKNQGNNSQIKHEQQAQKAAYFDRTKGSIGRGRYLKTTFHKNSYIRKQRPSKLITSNNLKSRHIRLQEGLPKSIRDIIPIQRYKKDPISQHHLYKDQINVQVLSQKEALGLEIIKYFQS